MRHAELGICVHGRIFFHRHVSITSPVRLPGGASDEISGSILVIF